MADLKDVQRLGSLPAPSPLTIPGPNFYPEAPTDWLTCHEIHLREARTRNPKVVFLGDSITEGWLREGLRSWQIHFARFSASNFAKGGDRVQNLRWKLNQGLLEYCRPNAIVLMIGVNNLWQDADEYGIEAVTQEIVALGQAIRAAQANAVILQLSVLPALQSPDHAVRKHINFLNAQLNRRAAEYGGTFVNVNQPFTGAGGVLDPKLMPDFVHLSAAGYELLAREISPRIHRAVGVPR